VATTINERNNKHQGLQIHPSDAGSRVAGPVALVLYLYEDVPAELGMGQVAFF
jgi:hypothetical protein